MIATTDDSIYMLIPQFMQIYFQVEFKITYQLEARVVSPSSKEVPVVKSALVVDRIMQQCE